MPEPIPLHRQPTSTAYPGTLRTIPFALFILLLVGEPILELLLGGSIDPRWLYGIRSGLVGVSLLVLWRHYTELRVPTPVRSSEWALGIATGVIVFVFWIQLDFSPLALDRGDGFDPMVDGQIQVGLAAARLAGSALVVPVMEELFWRSFILRFLQRPAFLKVPPSTVGWAAILLSSAVFASEHRLWFAGFLAGIAYAWLYKRSENLWVSIVAHGLTNALLGVYVLRTGAWWFW